MFIEGVLAVAQWVKNLTAPSGVTVKVWVQSLVGAVLKGATHVHLQLCLGESQLWLGEFLSWLSS